MTWTDSSGNLWLFGRDENDSTGQVRPLNDLWKYDGTNRTWIGWIWIGGANVAGQSGIYGTMGTAGSANIPGARSGAATWIDFSGNMGSSGEMATTAPEILDT
jgi:hypothetical protein